jgi:hypothetical protein
LTKARTLPVSRFKQQAVIRLLRIIHTVFVYDQTVDQFAEFQQGMPLATNPGQLINNPESRRRQYELRDRVRALGWEDIEVVDDDLGRTACGTERLGFDRLLAAVCTSAARCGIRNRSIASGTKCK